MYFRLLILLVLFIYSLDSFAQLIRRKKHKQITHLSAIKRDKVPFTKRQYHTLGITLNAMNYYGDLSPLPKRISTDINYTRPGLGLAYTIRKGPRFSLQTQFLYGRIGGSDAGSAGKDSDNGIYRLRRNASFKNTIQELSASVVFDLFENTSVYMHRVVWTPYVFFGASVFHHNPMGKVPAFDLRGNPLDNAGKYVPLRPLGTEGQYAHLQPGDANYGIKPYKLIQGAVLFGLGVRYRVNEVIDFWADLSFRYTTTDYLDDVSRNYVDLGVLPNDLSKAMSYRTYDSGLPLSKPHTYTGRDEKSYTVEAGYGSEYPDNNRGNKNNRDVLMITSLRVSHVIGKTFHKAKGR